MKEWIWRQESWGDIYLGLFTLLDTKIKTQKMKEWIW